MKFLLLLPVLAYAILLVFNIDLLTNTINVNFYNLWTFSVPYLLYTSLFFGAYFLFMMMIFDFIDFFYKRKIDKQEEDIIVLKSMLYDEREDILKKFIKEYDIKLDNFAKEQKEMFEKFKVENEMELLKQKWETNRILDKLNLVDKWVLDKLKDSFKG